MVLANYEPKQVLKHFEAISQIPRGSGNEKAVSDYIKNFAEGFGHKVVQDKWNNLIIYKPASPGYEGKETLMLQSHLDMVCEMNTGTTHDFLKDPLKLYVDGDTIKATGTTLGADNGIGVAMCMAVLEDMEMPHPPLEIVLTADEEAGMTGAVNLDASLLSSTRMINLDSGDENEFVMGCAAGSMVGYFIPVEWESTNRKAYKITVKGLKGGHSGTDITEDRGNAIRILGHVLDGIISSDKDLKIAHISGGMKVNAIPREAEATVVMSMANYEQNALILRKLRTDFAAQLKADDLEIVMEEGVADRVMGKDCVRKLIASLLLIPIGVFSMSKDIEGLPNASCNIGVLETLEHGVKISIMPRGAASHYNAQTEAQIKAAAYLAEAQVTFSQRSPAWPYNPNSLLLKRATECYEHIFDKKPKITATHGGLECGILIDKLPNLDIVSFGPNLYDIHTPDEGVSIKSTENVWKFVKEILKAL